MRNASGFIVTTVLLRSGMVGRFNIRLNSTRCCGRTLGLAMPTMRHRRHGPIQDQCDAKNYMEEDGPSSHYISVNALKLI